MVRLFPRLLASIHSNFHSTAAWSLVLFIFIYLINAHQSSGLSLRFESVSDVALQLAVVEAVKLAATAVYFLWRRRGLAPSTRRPRREDDDEEGLPLNHVNGFYEHTFDRSPAVRSSHRWHPTSPQADPGIPRILSISLAVLIAALFVYRNYNVILTQHLYEPFTTHLALSISTILTLIGLFAISAWTVDVIQYQAVFMQICGFLIIQAGLITFSRSPATHSVVLALTLSSSLAFILISYIYRSHHRISLEAIHIFLFAVSLLIHLVILVADHPVAAMQQLPHSHLSFLAFLQCISQAALDILVLFIVYYLDAPTVGVLTSLGAAIQFLFVSLSSGLYSTYLVVGCCAIIIASITYFVYRRDDDDDEHPTFKTHAIVSILRMAGITFFVILALYVAIATSDEKENLRYSKSKPPAITDIVSDSLITCRRKPLLSSAWYPHERSYHAFDDVLLIVFFSHARYDVNLDSYKEVYSEFFPNIIFVGPRSREDAGFNHSYDVLVDSYEAEEDLNDPGFYRMAGRMAHHMLYTTLDAHPCYNGYLWAPFDTLLNIPRLQQFNQNLFWYHSPFGQYVPNLALGDAAVNANKSWHPPPANISPDPELNLTATWRGWGPDWWWGEPHVGLEVCMRAFRKVPLSMRENLASLTNGTTRLIGGSADTLYIPGRHRQVFLETLGTFLETYCFLEIATPTAVHLVSPPNEPIQFVDHWWIWQPPFNASFVREKWAEGFEVDTFHTFHWGDKQADGVWRGNPNHISDVRRLFAESATRQNVDFPIRDLSVISAE